MTAVAATVGELLRAASARLRESGSETPLLDAELLLGHVLRVDRASVLAHPDAPVGPAQATAFEDAIGRRATGEPVAYIRGTKEFYGLALMVDRRALIPRPETETLVDLALDELRRQLIEAPRPAGGGRLMVWDVGTGSGAIVVALAALCRRRGYASDVRFAATDASPDALRLAVENAVSHGVADQIEFGVADLLEWPERPAEAAMIVANLPYIPSAVLPELPVAASFEPRGALDGGGDGLDQVRRLLGQLSNVLGADGTALLEFGSDQRESLTAAVEQALPGWRLVIHDDLGGRPRVAALSRAR